MRFRNITSTACGISAAAMLLAAASNTEAALINWGSATQISSDTDVSTAGTLVGAFALGSTAGDGYPGAGTWTVNGTTFVGLGANGSSSAGSANFTFNAPANGFLYGNSGQSGSFTASPPYADLSTQYKGLLSDNFNAFDSSFNPSDITLTISGLTPGANYQFETWDSYSAANGIPNYTETITDGVLNGITLINNTSNNADGGLGQFVIGTFTADASAMQSISFDAGNGGAAWINAVQLRQLPGPASDPSIAVVPEADPVVGALFLLSVCGFGMMTRVRRAWRMTSPPASTITEEA
jgi:hypothetical protein